MGRDVINILWPEFYQKRHEHSKVRNLHLVDKLINVAEVDIVHIGDIDPKTRHMGYLVLLVTRLVGLVVMEQVTIGTDFVRDGFNKSNAEIGGDGFKRRLGDNGATELNHAMNMRLLRHLVTIIIDAGIAIMHDEAAWQHEIVQLIAPIIGKILDQLHEPPTARFLRI